MINVSNEFLETMNERTDFMESATITFSDGEVLELSGDDFTLSNNSLTDAAGTSNFPLGVALEKTIQIELFNEDDHLWNYDFYGAVINLRLSLALSETTETIDYGTYTVLTPETYGTTVIIEAADDMYKADVEYDTNLEFPCTLREIVQDSCHTTGIYLLSTTFNNDQFTVLSKPENLTHREVIAMAAMIACGYARMDYKGRLVITSYSISMFDSTDGLDGGIFDNSDLDNSIELEGGVFDTDSSTIYVSGSDATGGSFNPWEDGESYNGGSPEQYVTGDWADGGSFNPWDEGDELDGGSFEDMAKYHNLYNFSASGLKLETDDVVITGVQIENDEGEEKEIFLCGEEGYVLGIENDLAEGKEEEVVSLIGAALIGFRFRPFEGDHIAYPIAEYGDVALVNDRKGRSYQAILTDIDFNFRGFTTFKCSAESPIRNSSTFAASSDYVKAVKAARKNTVEMITEYDKAVQMLTNLITNSFGVFKTEEQLEDGSIIYYLHDKPTLAESTTIWKMTADAFAVSTDGGKTWNAGMDSQGNVVANVLSVIGINFDWAHGGTLTLGGYNNDYGWMKILDANSSQIGKWDKDGIEVNAGSLTIGSNFSVTNKGELTSRSGHIANWTITSDSLQTGDYDTKGTMYFGDEGLSIGKDFVVTYNGSLYAYNAEFEGNISGSKITGSYFTTDQSGQGAYLKITEGTLSIVAEGQYGTGTIYGERATVVRDGLNYKLTEDSGLIISGGYYHPVVIEMDDGHYVEVVHSNLGSEVHCVNILKNLYAFENLTVYENAFIEGITECDQVLYALGGIEYAIIVPASVSALPNSIGTYAYTLPESYMGDIGSGVINEDGVCYVALEEELSSSADSFANYYVFLQKEGEGDLWVSEKSGSYFKVSGTPNLPFSWEVKMKTANDTTSRYNDIELEKDYTESTSEDEYDESEIEKLLREYDKEMEDIYYENLKSVSGY